MLFIEVIVNCDVICHTSQFNQLDVQVQNGVFNYVLFIYYGSQTDVRLLFVTQLY